MKLDNSTKKAKTNKEIPQTHLSSGASSSCFFFFFFNLYFPMAIASYRRPNFTIENFRGRNGGKIEDCSPWVTLASSLRHTASFKLRYFMLHGPDSWGHGVFTENARKKHTERSEKCGSALSHHDEIFGL